MPYHATYGIYCGVSPGFGVKYPDYVEERTLLPAKNDCEAFEEAMAQARLFAQDYLSDPEAGLTTVQLLRLTGPTGAIAFDPRRAIATCSMLEHFLQ